MTTYTSLETAETEMYPGFDFPETEASNIDSTASPTDENEWDATYDIRRETQRKASSEKTTTKWRMLLYALLAAAVVSSAVAAGKYAMKAVPGEPVTEPPRAPKVEPEPEPPPVVPPPAKPEIKPAPEPPPAKSLIETLTRLRFLEPFPVGEDEVTGLMKLLKSKPEVIEIKGLPVLREQLIEAVQGKMVDAAVLHVYSKLVQEHIDARVRQKLQKDVVTIGPAMFSQQWQDYFVKKSLPLVPAEVDIQRCKQASKVLIALPAPLGYAATGHFLLAVIDQEQKTISVVDSLPREQEYYTPIIAFIKQIAEQLNGDPSKPFLVSRDMPARGFPVQAEVLLEDASVSGNIYNFDAILSSTLLPQSEGALLDDASNQKLLNACGPMTLENMICIAENRRPNYRAGDALALRYRIVSELLYGIWGRFLVNEEFRPAGTPD